MVSMVSNFKGMMKGAMINREKRLKAEALRSYKRLYYGLTSFLYRLWEEGYKELNPWRQEIYILAPGKREEDGTWTRPEVDWEKYNSDRSAAWDEFMQENGMPRPLSVMTRKQLEEASHALVKFCQENWEVLPPFSEGEGIPDEGTIRETLIEINYDNLQAMGRYRTQELPEEIPAF